MEESEDNLMSHKEIRLLLPDKQYDEWTKRAKKANKPLMSFIEDSVEGHMTRSDIIKYLDKQSHHLHWWKKKSYQL